MCQHTFVIDWLLAQSPQLSLVTTSAQAQVHYQSAVAAFTWKLHAITPLHLSASEGLGLVTPDPKSKAPYTVFVMINLSGASPTKCFQSTFRSAQC